MTEAEAVEQFRAFVIKTARSFKTAVPEEDLVQEGYLAVALAFRQWKPEGGASLFTWIRQPVYHAMLKLVKEQDRRGGKFRGGKQGLTDGSRSGFDKTRKADIVSLDHPRNAVALQQADELGDSLTLHEIVGTFTDPGDVFALEKLPEAVARLTEEERKVIRLRFEGGLTHAQVGRRLGANRETARLIEQRALKRLKAMMTRGEAES